MQKQHNRLALGVDDRRELVDLRKDKRHRPVNILRYLSFLGEVVALVCFLCILGVLPFPKDEAMRNTEPMPIANATVYSATLKLSKLIPF